MEDAGAIEGTKGTPGFSAVRSILLRSQEINRIHERLSLKREPQFQHHSNFLSKQEWENIA